MKTEKICFNCIHKNVCGFKRDLTDVYNRYTIMPFSKLYSMIGEICEMFEELKEAKENEVGK